MLSQDEEHRLARLAQAGDERAFERLVRAHTPLVHAIAWEFRSYGLALDDLTSEGLLGLVKGARGFDPERGVRLASYAAWWIRAYIRRYTLDNRRIVRAPSTRNARRVLGGLRRVERELNQVNGEHPGHEAVARALGVSTRDVEDMRAMLGGRDVPCGGEVGGRHFDLPCHALSPEALAFEADDRRVSSELVQAALSRLAPRLREVIERRCLAQQTSTLEHLGQEMGVTRERVRQIEMGAKAQMRATISATMAARNIRKHELWNARVA